MKTFLRYALFLLLVPTVLLTSCKEDNPAEEISIVHQQVLVDYLKSSSLDLNNIIGDKTAGTFFVMAAPEGGDVSGKFVMDIRSAPHFAEGHIEGAVNVAFPNILTAAAEADKPILVVCYTGQTACYATTLLRLSGHSDAKALKWGMSGWSGSTDSWTGKRGNIADGHANWTHAAAPSATVQDAPSFTSAYTDGADILMSRVEAVVAEEPAGLKGKSATDVLENPGDYFINNYYSEAHYTGFGHINGAYRIQPLTLAGGEIGTLDPSKPVITYCYTGQTSAIITAYLRVLGYDAYSLKFGMNGLWNENPFWSDPAIKNQWGADSNSKDLPVVQ
jgi:rhodanese-related sulfurtransferase